MCKSNDMRLHTLIQLLDTLIHLLWRKHTLPKHLGVFSHSLAKLRRFHQLSHLSSQSLCISKWERQAVLALLNDIRQAPHGSRHHGNAPRPCLQHHHRETLMARAHAINARLVPNILLLLSSDIPSEGHALIQAHVMRHLAIPFYITIAHDGDMPVREIPSQAIPSLQEQVSSLVAIQMSGKDDTLLLDGVIDSRRRSAGIIDDSRADLHRRKEAHKEILPFLSKQHHAVSTIQAPDKQAIMRMLLQLIAHVDVHDYLLVPQLCQEQHRHLNNQANLIWHRMEMHDVILPYRKQRLEISLQGIP